MNAIDSDEFQWFELSKLNYINSKHNKDNKYIWDLHRTLVWVATIAIVSTEPNQTIQVIVSCIAHK